MLYVPGATDLRSSGLATIAGAALYAAPLYVWLAFSREIRSPGGLAAFVEAAAGRRVALLQAAVWAFSYFLYLPYTVTDIAYEMLPDAFPGITPWRWLLQLTIPVAIVALVVSRSAVTALAASAVAQLVLLLVLGATRIAHGHPALHTHHLATGAPRVSLLFVCGSLPLFLAAETTANVRRSLAAAGAIAAAYVTFAVIASPERSTRLFIVGAAVSVAGLIVAEYLALSRLLYWVVPRNWLIPIAVPFVALDALGLLDPEGFDEHLLRPSLIALYTSQLIVIGVFPLWRRRPVDVAIAAVAFAVMAYGLWRAIIAPVAT